jgi:hypothetical protein
MSSHEIRFVDTDGYWIMFFVLFGFIWMAFITP